MSKQTNLLRERPRYKGQWLTEQQAAERLNMSVKWLQKRRVTGEPPTYAKFGSAIRYSFDALQEFEQSCTRTSTSDKGTSSHKYRG
jgi:hypothetical protein